MHNNHNNFYTQVSLFLLISFTFLIPHFILSKYFLEIIAFSFISFYIIKHFFLKKTNLLKIELIVLTFFILILINSTGYINSIYFFGIYFLLFFFSYFLSILNSILLTIFISLLYLFSTDKFTFEVFIKFISIILFTPFAIYLVNEKQRIELLTKDLQHKTEDIMLFTHLKLKKDLKKAIYYLENNNLKQLKKILKNLINKVSKYEV
ncbi:MAG: hypothetical protein KatS3mg090_0658 [Patescibacteria group bacterium]|nr:MAG: hypothetical protein KatS3mg090_0658 [Patescibacteria group bacterium]